MFSFQYQLLGPGEGSGILDYLVDTRPDSIAIKIGPLGITATVLSFVLWAAALTVLVLLTIRLVQQIREHRSTSGSARVSGGPVPSRGASSSREGGAPALVPAPESLHILDERYAKGEIDHDDYIQRRATLLGLKTHATGGDAVLAEAAEQTPAGPADAPQGQANQPV